MPKFQLLALFILSIASMLVMSSPLIPKSLDRGDLFGVVHIDERSTKSDSGIDLTTDLATRSLPLHPSDIQDSSLVTRDLHQQLIRFALQATTKVREVIIIYGAMQIARRVNELRLANKSPYKVTVQMTKNQQVVTTTLPPYTCSVNWDISALNAFIGDDVNLGFTWMQ